MNRKKKPSSNLRLSHLFSDHAVLQRGVSVPVWGWTLPGLRVRVVLGSFTAETRADGTGRFLARLPPMPAGGPHVLEVVTPEPGAEIRLNDVMVGEVWVCSGQSNMELTVGQIDFAAGDLGEADECIRSFTVPREAVLGRQTDVNAAWEVASPKTVGRFSAVGFFFCRRLARELGVAVGMINTSWGGTRIETWISREELVQHPWMRDEVARYEATLFGAGYWNRYDPFEPDDPAVLARLPPAVFPRDPGNEGLAKGWAGCGYDDRPWEPMTLPTHWQACGHDKSGVAWFRRRITIPEAWAGKDLTLAVGAVDKQDTTYFNGVEVGATGKGFEQQHWNVCRSYTVPGKEVKAGRAVVAVRAYSFVHGGGLIGPRERMWVGPADDSAAPIPLDGEWRMAFEHDFGRVQPPVLPFGPGNAQSPYMLNDSMIQPLLPYAIRGATWYQGESNASRAQEYGGLLRAMIRDWRRAWGQGDFPFLTVQLANFLQPAAYQIASTWAVVREGQLRSLQEPNTGLAVTIDIGDAIDIHPRNKQDVGHRLAQWALARTYGKTGVCSGPLYRDCVIEGSRMRLFFDHTGGGLTARGGELKTFVIAGADRRFVPAAARIEGDTVVVESSAVAEPQAVRYAWADNPDGCNLYNRAGLPASPFRTDA